MSEITKAEKLAIIDMRERELAQSVYNQVISKRIGDMSKDENISKAAVANLEKLEKTRDLIKLIRAEVEAEKEKE